MKNGVFWLCFFGLLLFIPITVHAESNEPEVHNVGTSNLLIRTNPSSDGKVLGKLQPGDQVVIFQEQNGWAQTYYDGEVAWVATQYLIPSNIEQTNSNTGEQASSNKTIQVAENEVRLRSGPGTDHQVVSHLHKGDTIAISQTNGDWYKVKTEDGTTGWIASWLTTKQIKSSTSTSSQGTEATTDSLQGVRVVLDAGHGGEDPGAVGLNQVYEKNLTLITTEIIQRELEQAGADVIMTRTGDYYVSLDERVRRSNGNKPDVFISVHYNAFLAHTTNGFSTHYFDSGESRNLAQTVQSELNHQLTTTSRGIMNDDYYVLRHTTSPAVLLELGFLTNFQDMHTIQTTNYSERVAAGIKNALLKHF